VVSGFPSLSNLFSPNNFVSFHFVPKSHVHLYQLYVVNKTEIKYVIAVPRIIVIGPPAAGKGSISRMICKQLGTEHITIDCLMKESDSALASEAQEYCSSGSAIPVDLFGRLVHSRSVYSRDMVLSNCPRPQRQLEDKKFMALASKKSRFGLGLKDTGLDLGLNALVLSQL